MKDRSAVKSQVTVGFFEPGRGLSVKRVKVGGHKKRRNYSTQFYRCQFVGDRQRDFVAIDFV
jgi:hypothetical protein